jgi:hypothetical protein
MGTGILIIYQEYNSQFKFRFETIGRLLIYLIPLAGFVGVVATLALGEYNLFLLSLYLAVPMILSSLFYIIYTRNPDTGAASKNLIAEEYQAKLEAARENKEKLYSMYKARTLNTMLSENERKKWLESLKDQTNAYSDLVDDTIKANYIYQKSLDKNSEEFTRACEDKAMLIKSLDLATSMYRNELKSQAARSGSAGYNEVMYGIKKRS